MSARDKFMTGKQNMWLSIVWLSIHKQTLNLAINKLNIQSNNESLNSQKNKENKQKRLGLPAQSFLIQADSQSKSIDCHIIFAK